MKILITAFEPFGGETINSALESMNSLPATIGRYKILKQELPTVFYKATELVCKKIDYEEPTAVISLGQAGGRSCISVERVAINIDDTEMADNEGNAPIDRPICEDGENAYFSTLPIKKMVETLKKSKIPAQISNTAGTYVCNHLMYGVLHKIAKESLDIKAGFIHVPFIPEQVVSKPDKPSMSLDSIVKAIEIACTII